MNIGETIQERYQIEQVLGQGGMGTTYKALDLQTQHPVAVKVLNLSRMHEWKALEMFEREAKILYQLKHPRIPKYGDYFSIETASDVQFVLVQEYIAGKTLQQLIEEGWRGTEAECLDLFWQLIDLLAYLHQLRPPVVHRDINPKNIILSPKQTTSIPHTNTPEIASVTSVFDLYLVDFGAVQDTMRTTFLGGSTTVGTYGYVPLEQFNGQTVPASDYYAAGMTLLYMLTHRHPADFPMKDLKPKFQPYLQVSPAIIRLLNGLVEPAVEKRIAFPEQIQQILEGKSALLSAQAKEVAKPYGTKIKKIMQEDDHLYFQIPGKAGLGSLLILGFSIFWLAFVAVWTTLAATGSGFFALFSIPFWIVGLGMFGASVYNMFGRTDLELTPQWVQVRYSFWGIGYSQQVPTTSIEKLDVSTWYSKNNQPVQGITLHAGAKTLKFGSQLTSAEQQWVMNELEEYLTTWISTC